MGLIRALKDDPDARRIPIVAFYPHVETERRDAARAAGADQVLPRSAFTVRLASLLTGVPRSAR
jgi:CheY-like chemotaxis protein